MIPIVNTANLFMSVGHTHWNSWEKPGSASSTHFPACTVKDQYTQVMSFTSILQMSFHLSAFMPLNKYSVCSVCLFSTSHHPQVRSYSSPGQISFFLTSHYANKHSTARPHRQHPGGHPGRSWLLWWWGWGPRSLAHCPASWRCSHHLLPGPRILGCSLGKKTKIYETCQCIRWK